MHKRQHSIALLVLFMAAVFIVMLVHQANFDGSSASLAKAALMAMFTGVAALALIEMTDHFMFGGRDEEK